MKGKQTALMPGNGDKVGYWLTPPDLMAKLQAEFDFDFDACPYPRPAGFDGLKEPWGERSYVNPPFEGGGTTRWARKAVAEWQRGKLVVFIINSYRMAGPAAVLLQAHPEVRIEVVNWLNPAGEIRSDVRTNVAALFILRPKVPP